MDAPSVFRLSPARLLLPILLCLLCGGVVMVTDSNRGLFLFWNAAAAGWLPASAWAGITHLGSTLGSFSLLSPALVWQPRWVAAVLLSAPFATVYTHAIKRLVDAPRPPAVLPPEVIHIIGAPLRNHSFPSGHTLTVFVIAGVLALCVRAPLVWLAALVAALVAFSRVAVGAHWPLDLFGGAAGGWAAAAIGCAWAARWRFWESMRGQRILAAFALAAAIAFGFETLDHPEGRWMQYLLCVWGAAWAMYALWRPAAGRTP